MSTGEGEDPRDGQARGDGNERRGERIGVGGGDDSVSRIQLAARWAEAYAGEQDSLVAVLHRFRAAYDYLDAVIHGVEPNELDSEFSAARAVAATPPEPAAPPPAAPPPSPPAEQRPW